MNTDVLISELTYKAVRSSGSGGQHVNKVSSKVELYFDLANTAYFNDLEKEKLNIFYKNKVNKEGVLVMSCDESRSQFRNKAIVTRRFLESINEGLTEEKDRIKTKIPKSAVKKRLKHKKIQSEKKVNRKKPDL